MGSLFRVKISVNPGAAGPDGDTSLIPQNPSGWLLCQFHAVWRMVLRAL